MEVDILLPAPVRSILSTLQQQGHSAFAVGGCVRDSLMGRAPHDWDVCTSARPGEIKAAFPGKCLSAPGIRHGTVTVLLEHTPYEVTTFRTDGAYSDHRRPDSVRFVRSVTDDLARRDFTVNAMAYSPAAGLIDPFGGAADLAGVTPALRGETGAPLLRGRAARAAHGALCGHHGLSCGAGDLAAAALANSRRTDGGRHRTQQGGILQNALRPSCGACAAQLPRAVRAAAALSVSCVGRGVGKCGKRYSGRAGRSDGAYGPAVLCRGTGAGRNIVPGRKNSGNCGAACAVRRRAAAGAASRHSAVAAHAGSGSAAGPDAAAGGPGLVAHGDGVRQDDLRDFAAALGRTLATGACYDRSMLAVNGADALAAGIREGVAVGAALEELLEKVIEGTLPNSRGVLLEQLASMGGTGADSCEQESLF